MRFFTQEIKQTWLDALASGQFKYGSERLSRYTLNGPRYDALGVLAKVHGCLERGTFVVEKDGVVHRASDVSLIWWNPEDQKFEFHFGLGPKTQSTIAELNDKTGRWPVGYISKLKTGVTHP